MRFQWVEFFAGQAAATAAMKEQGLSTARLDYEYRSLDGSHAGTAMDICSDVGMGTLICNIGFLWGTYKNPMNQITHVQ
jgi:hypothetical protein